MLSQFKGKVLILKFMTGWCPTCHKNMALMKRLYQTYNEKGLEILCISLDRVKSWKKRNGEKETRHLAESQPFPFAWGDKAVYYQYGIFRSVPTLFLLDRELKIVKQIGSDDRSFEKISADIETLLK